MRNQLVPRAEIEEKVAELIDANHEATDEQVNKVAQLCVGMLLDIRDLLAESAKFGNTTQQSGAANKTS